MASEDWASNPGKLFWHCKHCGEAATRKEDIKHDKDCPIKGVE